MELDAEKIILEKIEQAEKTNITWNKEWVWSRIETPSKRKSGFIWYAAASLVIGLISISIYLISVKYENEMMAQINRLEVLMDQLPTIIATVEPIEEKCAEDTGLADNAIPTPSNRTQITSNKKDMMTNITKAEIDSSSFKMEIPSIDIKQEVLTSAKGISLLSEKSENIINPIIGKIPQTQNSLATKKSKEIKIQLFQSDGYQKSLMTDAREYKILSVNFNNN